MTSLTFPTLLELLVTTSGPLVPPLELFEAFPVALPLAAVIIQIGSGLSSALTFPPWVAQALTLTGFSVFGIGLMASYGGLSYKSRQWGSRTAVFGMFMIVSGFGFDAIISLLNYVLQP